jgi:hypothetical protein
MGKRIDLVGQRFFRLTVIAFAGADQRRNVCWLCRCDCGAEKVVRGTDLRSGHSFSCGCWKRVCATLLNLSHAHRRAGSRSREYYSWSAMIARCANPKNISFKNYGGRGIAVCSRWLQFENFLADMGRKPSPDLTLERRDNAGNYEPLNCYWATRSEQNTNQRPRKKAA